MEQGKMWLSNFHLTLFCQLFQVFCPVLRLPLRNTIFSRNGLKIKSELTSTTVLNYVGFVGSALEIATINRQCQIQQ
jgi:hypothetical protein